MIYLVTSRLARALPLGHCTRIPDNEDTPHLTPDAAPPSAAPRHAPDAPVFRPPPT